MQISICVHLFVFLQLLIHWSKVQRPELVELARKQDNKGKLFFSLIFNFISLCFRLPSRWRSVLFLHWLYVPWLHWRLLDRLKKPKTMELCGRTGSTSDGLGFQVIFYRLSFSTLNFIALGIWTITSSVDKSVIIQRVNIGRNELLYPESASKNDTAMPFRFPMSSDAGNSDQFNEYIMVYLPVVFIVIATLVICFCSMSIIRSFCLCCWFW